MNRVKELRKERKITQAKLAQELGISRSAVAMYETDKCDLSNEMLVALSNFFDVSTDYLLCQSDIKKAPTPEEVGALPEAQALREVMETLSPEDRRRILEFGRGLAATSHKPKQQK
ncbi:MAG TPA: helix-turn-helix domain-containing protein [Candidatus Agathobaculum pullistercoris]|nr:helix-turn-helix domain-containing protein [uncultured Agathobaculum sp.]HIX10234.1 helix-turn-helix domain-containing protein [Candidatus Agathobaculum pullistercoris]